PYNHCRSDIKFVEYASRGVVPVLSAITPYKKHAVHGSNAFLFEDNNRLKAILEDLIQNHTLRKEVSRNAYDYVRSHRMEGQHAEKRVEFYKNLCRMKTVKDLKALKLNRLSQTSEAYDVEKTDAEVFLRKGVANEANGNIRDARFLYKNAHELMPCYYLPLFWLGYSYMRHNDEEMAMEFFNRTIERNPRSVRSLLYLGNILEWREEKMALQAYKAASSISPSYAPSIEAIALFYENRGDYAKAIEFYNRALEANPFYSKAIWSLGRVYATLEEKEKALSAFRIAADMAPLHKEYQLNLAEYLFETGSVEEAAKYCLKALEIDKYHAPTRTLINNILNLKNKSASKPLNSYGH
ncbi:MAG: tetratricopeptide repeat protein, partial [Candidatus Scalindua sp.]